MALEAIAPEDEPGGKIQKQNNDSTLKSGLNLN